VNFSRRHLLASLGLVLPTMAVMATEANAAASTHKKHKPTKHGATTQAAHKVHKSTSRPSTQS